MQVGEHGFYFFIVFLAETLFAILRWALPMIRRVDRGSGQERRRGLMDQATGWSLTALCIQFAFLLWKRPPLDRSSKAHNEVDDLARIQGAKGDPKITVAMHGIASGRKGESEAAHVALSQGAGLAATPGFNDTASRGPQGTSCHAIH